MPTYDYICDACNHKFEQEQKITEKALTKCPECSKKKLRRVIGATTVRFVGQGWTPKGNDQFSG